MNISDPDKQNQQQCKQQDAADYEQAVSCCRNCGLAQTRIRPVWGNGCYGAQIMLLGEAPGATEDQLGRPFAGKAGGLLDDFLAATAIPRAQLYISNVVKCRPVKPGKKPGSWVNRLPARTEISACRCHFLAELALVQPKLIVTLGATPLAVFAHQKPVMSQWHGQPFVCGQTPIFPLYHPAAVIYNRNLAQEYAADMRCLHGYLLAESLL